MRSGFPAERRADLPDVKVRFGMALRQMTGFVESLLRLVVRTVGLDCEVPDVSTLSRRQKTLAVNIGGRRVRCTC